jgi:hypothetical protein
MTRLTLASLFTAVVVVLAAGGSSPAMAKATRNLIKNPGAENGTSSDGSTTVPIPSWIQQAAEEATVISYGDEGTSHGMPGPPKRGTQLWYGGINTATPDLQQRVDISNYVTRIKRGDVKFAFTGWFGGYSNNNDTSAALVTFENANGHELKSVRIGDPTAADRGNVSGMLADSASGKVPAKTRKLTVDLIFTYGEGISNDSYADNLSLKFL